MFNTEIKNVFRYNLYDLKLTQDHMTNVLGRLVNFYRHTALNYFNQFQMYKNAYGQMDNFWVLELYTHEIYIPMKSALLESDA